MLLGATFLVVPLDIYAWLRSNLHGIDATGCRICTEAELNLQEEDVKAQSHVQCEAFQDHMAVD